jgi:hypothetical protein
MRLAERTLTTARVHPALRCVCGHVVSGYDLDLDEKRGQLFPTAHALLAHKRDHGRAEAALIALTHNGGAMR